MVDPIEEAKKTDQKKSYVELEADRIAQEAAEKALQEGEIGGRKVTTTPPPQSDKINEIAKKQQSQRS